MKYQVTFSCGHEGKVEVFGKNSARQYKIDQAAKGICPECVKEQKELAASAIVTTGLPELEGSEKQIAWAIKIRDKVIAEFNSFTADDMEYVIDQVRYEHKKEMTEEAVRAAFENVKKQTSASFFINYRGDIAAMIAKGVR